jgi:hypothetical protein
MELNGRVVVDVEIDGVDTRDYPDFCDAYFSYAVYADDGSELTDAELEQLSDKCGDKLNVMAFESCLD